MKKWLALAGCLMTTMALAGCGRAWRIEAGTGLGLGADLKVPGLLHTGLAAGRFHNKGFRYDTGWRDDREDNATLLLWHWERNPDRPPLGTHTCWGLLPPLTTTSRWGDEREAYSLEIGLMLVFVDLRIGFNPFGVLP